MGLIKEPLEIDLIVDSRGLTPKDLDNIDVAINQHKMAQRNKKATLIRPTRKILQQ
ncbi:MAG: hypothetical protein ACOVO2_19970 [Emticicia sp.]|uniref:hypothetical protein n=1 Tax=Emticicia sp. TaxID=1930953 RepID=UPI003BA6D350